MSTAFLKMSNASKKCSKFSQKIYRAVSKIGDFNEFKERIKIH